MSAGEARTPERQEIDLEVYYVRYGPMVLRRCRKMLRDEQAAFDAMQEVFVKLLVHKEKLDGRYPSSLLYTIATNHCLNRLRDQRRRGETVPLPLDREIAGRPLEDTEAKLRGLLDPVLKEEREDTRQMAYLYFIDGLSLENIALEMDMSVAGIHKRLRRLRRFHPRQGSEP
jgi:RNA polymerase sigma-70 factor (ECF subfamily)